jgi:1-aminocyclopropane-1-carboxylate deaminase/D-cysteine desulfhydrase-like pyridoxal-dependent ACC family enzyme
MTSHERKQELKQLLDRMPRYPLSLLPTPLTELPRFSEALAGPRILIKRDDLTGLAYGGNKTRKLDYFIGEAIAQGCDVFIGGGGAVQSNHALQCAAAARKAGMIPVILARAGTHHYALQGDYLLTKLLVDGGVYLYSLDDGGSGRRPSLADLMEHVAEKLRGMGHTPYILPGSGQPTGTLGYVECTLELTDQCETLGIAPDWVFITSSGGGQAGLLLGARFLEQRHRVVGCAPSTGGTAESRGQRVADLANRTAELLGAETRISPDDAINLDCGGQGYGIPSEAGMEALRLLARTEGIFLDPVYSSKGMSGLIDQIRQGVVGAGDTVIFVHTGGGPLNFAYSAELAQAFGLNLECDERLTMADFDRA